ncbi:MAG: radical SAM protein [Candidatus Bathyarchaeota archaeon]
MKFSFINAGPNEPRSTTMTGASPPLGILYIASMLKHSGIEVSALDQTIERYDVKKVVDWVMKENPDILGISTILSSTITAPRIAKAVKEKNPNITIIFGNHHATNNAERILTKYPSVDFIVRGEGEQTCLELVEYLQEKRSLKDILGLTFRHEGTIITNPDRPLLIDIDSLPFPDRELLEGEYHNTTIGVVVAPKKFTSILSSRGCVFRCRYCSCTSIARNFWRPRSIENIIEELRFLTSEGYKQLMFVDDNFSLNQQRVIELCQRIRKEKIDVEWISEGRVDQCSYEMFREMVKAGCRMTYFGIESANQKVLDYYRKMITPEQSIQTLQTARKAGVAIIVGSFIVGAPDETKEEVQRTLEFTKQLDLDIPQINLLQANPGTPLWEEFRQSGFLNEEESWESGVYISDICPSAVPRNELLLMIRKYYGDFLKRPQYIIKQTILSLKSLYRINVLLNNMKRREDVSNSIRKLTQ